MAIIHIFLSIYLPSSFADLFTCFGSQLFAWVGFIFKIRYRCLWICEPVRFIEMPIQFSIKWKELFALWHLSLLFFPSSLLSVSQRIKTSEVLPAIHCVGDEILIVNFEGKKNQSQRFQFWWNDNDFRL